MTTRAELEADEGPPPAMGWEASPKGGAKMKAMINFTKAIMNMPFHWQIWLGLLITVNIVVPFLFINTMEAQIVMATAIAGLALMAVIYSEKGFVRLMGIGHIGWFPLVYLLWMRLDFAPAHSAFGYWLIAVIVLDSLSLFIDHNRCPFGTSKASEHHISHFLHERYCIEKH